MEPTTSRGVDPPNQAVFILCGLPASGKSTLAASIAADIRERIPASQVKILDIDLLRAAMHGTSGAGNAFDPALEAEVRAGKLNEIDDALGKGLIVIDDDVNYFRSMRKEVADVACKHRVHYAIIHVATPLKQCIAWNAKRERQVPVEVIKDIARKMDMPGSRSYSWDEPLVTINLAKMATSDAMVILQRELDKAALLLRAKEPVAKLLGATTSVMDNPAFWNLALLGRIVNDGFLINDVQEWRDSIQGMSSSALDRFEVATRRAINARVTRGEALSPSLRKEIKRYKHDAMKVLKTDPTKLDAFIAGFNDLLGTKNE
ncbi:MAG: AAA family ATPase [Candidatus Sigynarchaeota archaeon]